MQKDCDSIAGLLTIFPNSKNASPEGLAFLLVK